MTNVLAIARRELGAYFDSPLAYFIVPVYVVLVGGFTLWFDDVFVAATVSLRGLFFWSGLFLLLLVPAVTMRLFAEERRTGSIELLATLPLTESELVAGKYLAALVMVAVTLASTFTYPLMFAWLGLPPAGDDAAPALLRVFTETSLDWGPALGGYLGLFALGAALAAVGTAASSLTANQIVAYLLAVVLSVFPWVAGMFLDRVPADLVPFVQYLTFSYHFDNLARGVFDSRDLVFWGSVVGLCLHGAVWTLEKRRLG